MQEIWREFSGIFFDPHIKAQKFRGKFRSIFREKFRASKKIFRANFVLQTCHPKNLWPKAARSGPHFDPKIHPTKKTYVGPFFCVLSQEMRHRYFFFGGGGGTMGRFGWEAKSFYVEGVHVLILSLNLVSTFHAGCFGRDSYILSTECFVLSS